MKKIDKELIFFKGREYESLRQNSSQRIFFGYGCLIGTLFFLFTYLFDHLIGNVYVAIVLLLVSFGSLYVGYSDKRRMEKIK